MGNKKSVKITESKIKELILKTINESLSEDNMFTRAGEKFSNGLQKFDDMFTDYHNGFETKEGNPQSVADVFVGDGWEIIESPQDGNFGIFKVKRTMGAFGGFYGQEIQEMIEEINIFLNNKGVVRYLGKEGDGIEKFEVVNTMKNENNMKITESQLRRLVESCVKEALEEELEEGFGWDAYKANIKGHEETKFPSWDETKEFINGEPNEDKFLYHKDRYDAAKDGNLYDPDNYDKYGMKGIADDEASDAVFAEPGMKGKARRAAIVGGYAAGVAKNKIKKGFSKLGKKNNGTGSSFTM